MDSIKYLIKFVEQEQYADDLLNGKLFMRPAGYYRWLEEGRGDFHEAAVSGQAQIFKGDNHPIYCMYAVHESDVHDKEILIDPLCIEDLKCKDGWAVVVDYRAFCDLIPGLQCDCHAIWHGEVNYRSLSMNDTHAFMVDSSQKNLFYKRPQFSHQHEYRFVIGSSIMPNLVPGELDGEIVDFLDMDNPYKPIIYHLPNSLNNIAKKFHIGELTKSHEGYCLNVEKEGCE